MEQTDMLPADGLMMESYLEEVRRYLEKEGRIIGIWGMWGIGKSILLRAIYNSFLHQTTAAGAKVFDHVIFVTVGKELRSEKLQKDITNSLNLPWNGDLQTQSAIIFDFLKEKNFLLLLDDIGEEVDLGAIGVPILSIYTGGRRRLKMVLTTRSWTVSVGMDSHKIIIMECLGEEEAWNLFKETIGGNDILDSRPDIRRQRRAIEVANECSDIPLVLVVVGRAMSTKQTLQEWDYTTLSRLKKSKLGEIMGDSMFWIFKFCYDSLTDEKIKDCFICCSLWPADFRIEKEKLVMSWMGLGFIDDFEDINEAYDYGYVIIEYLTKSGLLEPVQNDDGAVKMHDMLKDLAQQMANEKYGCVTGLQQLRLITRQRKCEEVKRVSLMYTSIEQLTLTLATAYCPNLFSFCLQYSLLREMPGESLLHFMPNLTYLDLSANYSLRKIPNEIGCLVRLRYLNLSYTKISSLPEELSQLSNLKYLLLRHTWRLVNVPCRMLSSLSRLEVLEMYPHGICSSDELAYLPRGLKALGGKITSVRNLQRFSDYRVPIIGLSMKDMGDSTSIHLHLLSSITQGCLQELKIRPCNNIKELVMDVNSLPRLTTLVLDSLENMREIVWRNVVPCECFPRLQVLNIYKCHGLKSITWVLHLPSLEYLSVKECDGMEHLIVNCDNFKQDGDQAASKTSDAFPSLRSLRLFHLPKLNSISNCPALICFPCLGRVEIFSCPELKKLPFRPQLNCKKLSSIRCQRTWWEGIQWEEECVMSFHSPGAEVCNIEFDTLENPYDSSEFDSSQASDNSIEEEEIKCCQGSQTSNFRDEWSSLQVLYSDIKDATNGFSESSKIGKGGYGSVYKGKLGGTVVAIKMLDSTSKQGEKEFFQELEVLHEMRHPNLVKLVGACLEVRALVYEYLPHGSLEDCLKDNPNLLTWQMRTRIIYEICSALIYLHSRFVVHGDLKPANILLNANFKSKLSDFGLCRFLPKDMSSDVFLETVPKGTTGYIDPWFLETCVLRPGSDLYSFGITILKLLTGLPPIGLGRKAYDADENLFLEMIDLTAGGWPFELAKELLYWSLQCCYHNEKSSELLKDMSTSLEDMLAEIETIQKERFKV